MRWALALGRTARELLASVTSEEITEMMAFERMEPFGALADEARIGQVAATVANVHRDPKSKRDAWTARDFMPALDRAVAGYRRPDEPIFLEDPEAMSQLIKQAIFRLPPKP